MAEYNTSEDKFLDDHSDFSLRELVKYPNGGVSRFYDNDVDMVVIDENICVCEDRKSYFRYMLITDKQNNYMHIFRRLFRFLGYIQEEVDKYLYSDEINMPADHFVKTGDRSEQADVSPLELHFFGAVF